LLVGLDKGVLGPRKMCLFERLPISFVCPMLLSAVCGTERTTARASTPRCVWEGGGVLKCGVMWCMGGLAVDRREDLYPPPMSCISVFACTIAYSCTSWCWREGGRGSSRSPLPHLAP
jgi:hypothetical protein